MGITQQTSSPRRHSVCRTSFIFQFIILTSDHQYDKKCKEFWQQTWTNQGTITKLHRNKPNLGFWPSSNRKSRIEETAIARLRIGHTYITHSFIIDRQPQPRCARCRAVLTIEHILIHCHRYNAERTQLQQFCTRNNLQFGLPTLLEDDNNDLLKLLFSFLRTSDLLRRLEFVFPLRLVFVFLGFLRLDFSPTVCNGPLGPKHLTNKERKKLIKK